MSEFDLFDQITNDDVSVPFKIEEEPKDVCAHQNLTTERGITECLDCGTEIKNGVSTDGSACVVDKKSTGDNNRCWAPKRKNKSIRDSLKGLGFPDPIVNETDSIFKTVTGDGIYRSDKRNSIIVACLLEAHKALGCQVSLESLKEKLPISDVTVGMKFVEPKIKKYDTERKRITYTSPVDSIRDILSKWETEKSTINEVIELYQSVDNKSSLINRSRAKSVAAGVIYYYSLATRRTNIKLKEFSKRVELSESTITKVAKEVSAILESPNVLAY